MKTRPILFAFLMVILASCAPAVTMTPTITAAPPTSTAIPPTPTETPMLDLPSVVATPLPIQQPMFEITPDAIQVTRWQDYQMWLGISLLDDVPGNTNPLCEWDILGRSDQDVYIWATCISRIADGGGGGRPAVIHLNIDGSIQGVHVPVFGTKYASDVQRLFPSDIQEKIAAYDLAKNHQSPLLGKSLALGKHLSWRKSHPEEPPLIIISATPQP